MYEAPKRPVIRITFIGSDWVDIQIDGEGVVQHYPTGGNRDYNFTIALDYLRFSHYLKRPAKWGEDWFHDHYLDLKATLVDPDEDYVFGTNVLPQSIDVFGRRWFQRAYGNTYFTADISVDGTLVHTLPKQYGYGDHYLDIAFSWLEDNAYIPRRPRPKPAAWHWAEDYGIALTYEAVDVRREKDL
jgi:hypothetical protein